MAPRRAHLRRAARVGPACAVVALAGFLLGSCAGEDGTALTTGTGLTGTRPALTGTLPDRTVPTRTVTEPGTTATEPATTESVTPPPPPPPPETVTTVETRTTSVTILPPRTTESTPMTTAPADTTSSDDTPWGWILLALAVAAAAVTGLLVWRHRRARSASWDARLADLRRRSLVATDDLLSRGSVVTGQVRPEESLDLHV